MNYKMMGMEVSERVVKNFLHNIFSIKIDGSRNKKIIKICGIKIKLKRSNRSTKELLAFLEKEIIAQSPFWDDLWYVQKYGHNFTRQEALNYWYKKGCKKGENPSKYINLEVCGKFCHGLNPVIAYQSKQFAMMPDNKNNYKEENDSQKIKEYLEYKQNRKAKSVVYTCITNDYDDLREIETYKYVDKYWDYVCFSDNEEMIKQGQVGIWEVRPLQFNELDNTRNNRWHKLLPHKLFPQYEESIYIDANINIISEYLFKTVKEADKIFMQPRHYQNMCIYKEYENVLDAKLDGKKLILDELELIKNSGMPKNYGLGENNILYRKHNDEKMIKIDEEWWQMVSNYAKRDQLSFAYLLWKNGINIKESTFENSRLQTEHFYVFAHKKGRS